MPDFPVNTATLALVNVDMQNCFVENSPIAAPGGLEVLEKINRLIDTCRENGVPIIHTSHVVRPDGSNIGVMGEINSTVKDGVIDKGSPSAALHDGLNVKDSDILLDKPRFGAFHGTDLELILRSLGIDTIIVTGICTNVCCETTAREANVRDFRVFFLSDGTATFAIGNLTAEQVQEATVTTLGRFFAQVETVDGMMGKIRTAGVAAEAAE